LFKKQSENYSTSMKNLFLLCLFIVFVSACATDSSPSGEIARLEKENDTNPTPETSKLLVESYLTEVANAPDNAEQNSRYLYRAASLYYRQNRFQDAELLLNQALQKHPQAESNPNVLLLLANIYEENRNQPEMAQAIYRHFAKQYPNHAQISEVNAKLKPNEAPFETYIDDIGNRMYDDSTFRIDNRLAADYVNSCLLFASLSPENPKSPVLLFKAGETARTVRNFSKSIEIYDWVYEKYPDFEKAPQALFLKGFTLDNDMKRHSEAKAIYESFLAKYPNDDFADDTKFLLNNIGKSDDDIIKNFENK